MSKNHLTFTNMTNAAGKRVASTMDTFQAAAANPDFSKAKDFYLILTNQPGERSWPIRAATYMLSREDSPADQIREVLKFLDWALKNGQPQAKALEYVPLPDQLVKDIKAHWSRELSGVWELASR